MSRPGRILRLSMLSRHFVVRSDRSAILRIFRFQYRHFLAGPRPPRAARHLEVRLGGSRPGVGAGGRWIPLAPGASLAELGTGWIFEALLDEISDHLFFHAGVVSRGRRALLICGPPGFGKTSLVLALARRPGFRFLSDDFAPLSPRRGTVAPFPRSVGLVAESALARSFLRGVPPAARRRFADKWLVDPAAVPGLTLGRSCRPGLVLMLGPPESAGTGSAPSYEISLVPRLRPELRRLLAGVRLRRSRTPGGRGRLRLRFSLPPEGGLAGRLQAWMGTHREGVYSLVREYPRGADFRPPARATRIPGTAGLIEMLADLQNRRPGGDGSTGTRTPGRLLVDAAGLLGPVPFYRIRGGTLPQRVALVEKIFPSRPEPETE